MPRWLSDVVWTVFLSALAALGVVFVTTFFGEDSAPIVRIFALGGALGGLLASLIRNDRKLALSGIGYPEPLDAHLTLALPAEHFIRLGALADSIIGVGAAWALLALKTSINLFGTGGGSNLDRLQLLGLSVVAGFSGISLLRGLSQRLDKQIEEKLDPKLKEAEKRVTQQAQKTIEQKSEETEQKNRDSADAGSVLSLVDLYDTAESRGARHPEYLDAAESFTERELKKAPNSPQVLWTLAMIKRRRAFAVDGEQRKQFLNEAIESCSKAIAIEPFDEAFYNRGCYRALKGESAAAVAADLRKAIEMYPANKEKLRDDPDIKPRIAEKEIADALK